MASLKNIFNTSIFRRSSQDNRKNFWLITPLCIGIGLWLLMIPYRGLQIGYTLEMVLKNPIDVVRIMKGTYHDFWLVLGMIAIFTIVGLLTRSSKLGTKISTNSFLFLAIFAQGFAVVNLIFRKETQVNLTYQWLLYADFLSSTDSQNAIVANFDIAILWDWAIIIAFILTIPFAIRWLVYKVNIHKYFPWAFLVGSIIFLSISSKYLARVDWTPMQVNNSSLIFLGSLPIFQNKPGLLSEEVSEEAIEKQKKVHSAPSVLPPIDSDIKNVVLIVLESVQASYLEVYGNEIPVTPNIKRFEDRSLQVSNAYAHIPATHRAMFATLSSLYPNISYNSITKHSTNIETPTISKELHKRGYRTSFFTSADNRFKNIDKFLVNNDFETIKDYQSIECETTEFKGQSSSKFLDGIEDVCIGGAFEEWLDEDSDQPFFSVVWTVQTHYPYYNTGDLVDYDTTMESRNAYLNALKQGDELFGNIMDLLIDRGYDENTLVVLMGDHGEAFYTHEQAGHANEIYEENVHIPLIFYHPTLFSGEKKELIAGEIDIAPSIFHLLGIEAPERWQGQSVFMEDFRNSIYFYSIYKRFVFGYRENEFKILYDAGDDFFEVYNLEADPREQNNIADQHPELTEKGYENIASWIQYHNQVLQSVLGVDEIE